MEVTYSEHETPLVCLGRSVVLNTFGCALTLDQEQKAIAIFSAAFALLGEHERELTDAQTAAIAQIDTVIVPTSDSTDLGATGTEGMTLSLAYIEDCSTEWTASLVSHEGQHHLNTGKFIGVDLWQDELSACTTQLGVGNAIGFTDAERQYLVKWMGDRDAMQAHMLSGYAGPRPVGSQS